MSLSPVVIGIDAGTTAVKAVAFTLEAEQVATASRAVPVALGPGDIAECDLWEIWAATVECLRELTARLAGRHVVAVGVTGQGDGLWLLDDQQRPVRKAPCWMDGRAAERARLWATDGRSEAVLQVTGTTVAPGATALLYAELAETAPQDVARAATALYCKDWVRLRLTGEPATDFTEASRALLDIEALSYSQSLAARLGVEPLLALLPQPRRGDELAGCITAEAAAETGLPVGTPVATGILDVAACGLGVGASRPGDGWVILGTTACVGVQLSSPKQRRLPDSMVMATGWGSGAVEFLVPASSVPNLAWARRLLGLQDLSHDEVEAMAVEAGPGAGGVAYLPYGAPIGERAPFLDPAASAAWLGLGYGTTPGQAMRAVFEGIVFALAETIEAVRLSGRLVVTGGGARSPLLCRLLADVLQRPVVRTGVEEAGALGAAMTAMVAIGAYPDLEASAEALHGRSATVEPRPGGDAPYLRGRRLLSQLRAALSPHWPELRAARLAASTAKE